MYILISYLTVSGSFQQVYGLTVNYVALENKNNIEMSWNEILTVDKDTSVTVIAEYENGVIGFYDPSFRFAFQNMMHMVGKTRYLSLEDYVNKTKAGIVISDSLVYDMAACQSSKNAYFDEILYCSDTMSAFGNEGKTSFAVNLTAMDTLGKRVYIDTVTEKNAEFSNIVHKLKALGYEKFDSGFTWGKFFSHLQEEPIVLSWMILLVIILCGILWLASYWHYIYLAPVLRIHFLLGGSPSQIFRNQIKDFYLFIIFGLPLAYAYHIVRQRTILIVNANLPIALLFFVFSILFLMILRMAFTLIFAKKVKQRRS